MPEIIGAFQMPSGFFSNAAKSPCINPERSGFFRLIHQVAKDLGAIAAYIFDKLSRGSRSPGPESKFGRRVIMSQRSLTCLPEVAAEAYRCSRRKEPMLADSGSRAMSGEQRASEACPADHAASSQLQSATGNDPPTFGHRAEELAFDGFRLLPTQRLLVNGDEPVRLGSRALDLLIALSRRPGQLISKQELTATVWPDTFVDQSNLKVHVSALRRALGDGKTGRRYISTVAGRGYCFVTPVKVSADGGARATAGCRAATAPQPPGTVDAADRARSRPWEDRGAIAMPTFADARRTGRCWENQHGPRSGHKTDRRLCRRCLVC